MITKGLSTHREDVGGAAAATAAAAASAAAGEDVAQIVEVAEFAHGRTAFLADEEVQRRAGRQREDGADRGAVAHRRRRVGHDRRQTTAGALGDDPSGNEPPFVTHSKNGEEEKKRFVRVFSLIAFQSLVRSLCSGRPFSCTAPSFVTDWRRLGKFLDWPLTIEHFFLSVGFFSLTHFAHFNGARR